MELSASPDIVEKILLRDAVRVRRMKWITITAWAVVVICFVGVSLLWIVSPSADRSEHPTSGWVASMMSMQSLARVLAPFALIFTISFYIRSRTLTIHQIQARLTGIENLLREMLHDEATT